MPTSYGWLDLKHFIHPSIMRFYRNSANNSLCIVRCCLSINSDVNCCKDISAAIVLVRVAALVWIVFKKCKVSLSSNRYCIFNIINLEYLLSAVFYFIRYIFVKGLCLLWFSLLRCWRINVHKRTYSLMSVTDWAAEWHKRNSVQSPA